MRILYVTDAWHGFREVIFEKETSTNGLPSFNLVLQELIKQGNEIDFVIIQNRYKNIELNIGVSWLVEDQFKDIIYVENSKFEKVSSYFKLIWKVFQLLRKNNYNLVYAHGTTTGLALLPAKILKIPFGQRVYGTFLWDKYLKTKNKLSIIKHFNQYLAFKAKKNFLIVTNDGSRGDLVKKLVCKDNEPYEFYYWTNGVNRPDIGKLEEDKLNYLEIKRQFIFYPARFDKWKRHDRVINILSILRKKGVVIDCYFAGAIETNCLDYFNDIKSMAEEKNVINQVHFIGNVNNEIINLMHRKAIASLALYDVCSFTNVFHEMLAAGAVSIVKNDNIVSEVVINGENGYLVEDDDLEIANIIMNLLDNNINSKNIRENAIITSMKYIKSWPERIDDEIKILKAHAR